MSNALVPVADIYRMAEAIAKSNLFGVKTVEQAAALMLVAQAEGMHPAVAARDYHIVDGKPTLKADAMLARFQAAGGKVEWRSYTDDKVSALFTHPAGGSVEIGWSIEQAKRAGLTGKKVWSQYPRQMLRARVISEGIRTVFPGVAVGVYTPEEVQDFDARPQLNGHAPQERDMGPVELAQPAVDPDLRARAENAAKSGLAAYQAFFSSQITKDERKLLAQSGAHESFKAMAIQAPEPAADDAFVREYEAQE